MRNSILFLCLTTLFSISLHAQTASSIKSDPTFLWGEGKGKNLRTADNIALSQLISQISVTISEQGTLTVTDNENSLESIIKTYSNATLNNTHRLVVSDEPDAHVLRYIKKSDLDAIWKSRINKVKEFCAIAHQAYQQRNIGDALRYYYWANVLLQSLPNPNGVQIEDEAQNFQNAVTWIPLRMNEILSGITVKSLKRDANNLCELSFFFQGKPVANLDFTYFDGQDWSPVSSAQDGIGIAEFRPGFSSSMAKIKIEYQYYADALSDKEVNSVLEAVSEVGFPKCMKEVTLSAPSANATAAKQASTDKTDGKQNEEQKELDQLQQKVASSTLNQTSSRQQNASQEQLVACQKAMDAIVSSIKQKNYSRVQQYCTEEGFQIFDKLIHYGQARIVGTPQLKFSVFDNAIYCRSLTLNFQFSRQRTFIEDVAFVFSMDGKLDNIQFGLGKVATEDVLDQPIANMSEDAKSVLVNFLENYKTAYALGRIDYLENIFSDDALIITGKVVTKATGNIEKGYQNNRRVVLTRQNKVDYIKHLRRVFASNEFVNLKFANNRILKSGKGGELYAIQIRQDYFSANYGDSGYLFLLVDVNDPDHPIIHVRAWQEMPDADWGLIDMGNF